MLKINTKLFFLCAVLYCMNLSAQAGLEKTLRGYTPPDELISLSANIQFSKAIDLLNKVSEKKTGKKLFRL